MKTRVYVSSAFTNKPIVADKWVPELTRHGYEVISTWHEEEMGNGRKYRRYAARDIDELATADVLVMFTRDFENSSGGMWVELGYMLATRKTIVMIGPTPMCIFAKLACIERYQDLEDFLYGVGE